MSLISSHHGRLMDSSTDKESISSAFLKEITQHVIEQHPELIVDVESGKSKRIALENQILAYLDTQNHYHFNRNEIVNHVMDYMFGYGRLQPLIEDEEITDIDVCRYNYIVYRKYGRKFVSEIVFDDQESLFEYSKLLVIRHGGTLNEKDCHARVADRNNRLRMNVTIGPRNINGPSITIRKHRLQAYSLDQLVQQKMMNQKTNKLLRQLMLASSRILIVGKGAAGKTTLLRALLHEIPYTERFLVCESESELYPEQSNFIVQKVSQKEKGASLNQLIKDGLTMSLDGYCIGELIGDEVGEFLKAGYTDHRILGTLHATGIKATFDRVRMMMKTHQGLSDGYIAGALDIIIYMRKFKVISITEVSVDGNQALLNELVQFQGCQEGDGFLSGHWNEKAYLQFRLKDELKRRFYLE